MGEEIREVEPVVEVEGPKRASTNKVIVIAVIGIVVVLVMFFTPFVPMEETYLQSYMDTEWESQEYERYAKYEVPRHEAVMRFGIPQGFYYDIYVKVRNIDVEGGTFSAEIKVWDISKTICNKEKSNYIAPGDSYQFAFYCDVEFNRDYDWSWDVDAPTIIDTHLVVVDVQKQREAERTVYKSVYQILTGG